MALDPELTDFGFGVWAGVAVDKRTRELRTQRAALLGSGDTFRAACVWIEKTLCPQERMNYRHSSYELKHIAECEMGYLTNGVFIAAMLHCGYSYEKHRCNGFFNVSEQSVRAAYRQLGPRYALLAGG